MCTPTNIWEKKKEKSSFLSRSRREFIMGVRKPIFQTCLIALPVRGLQEDSYFRILFIFIFVYHYLFYFFLITTYIYIYIYIYICVCTCVCVLVGCLGLWPINLCRLFNAKSIFIQIVSSISNIQFSMSTQFKCQKHFHFKLFSLFKQF